MAKTVIPVLSPHLFSLLGDRRSINLSITCIIITVGSFPSVLLRVLVYFRWLLNSSWQCQSMTSENVKPAYGGDEEDFLTKVVSPIYDVIAKEAAWRKVGKSKHSQWRNYDDLNEYFWSVDCFRLGWPMRADADFFCEPMKSPESEKLGDVKPVGRNRGAAKKTLNQPIHK